MRWHLFFVAPCLAIVLAVVLAFVIEKLRANRFISDDPEDEDNKWRRV